MSIRTALAAPFTRIAMAIAGKAVEGATRPGPWTLPITGATWSVGAPSYGQYWNNWQLAGEPWGPGPQKATAEACKALYAGAVSLCPAAHYVKLPNGGKRRVDSSDLSRIILDPNSYQSWSDFIAESIRCMLDDGNSYSLAVRNRRGEVAELHPMDPALSFPLVTPEGEVGYMLAGNPIIDADPERYSPVAWNGRGYVWSARNVLHLKLPSYRSRRLVFLMGESPLIATLGVDEILRRLATALDQKSPKAVATIDAALNREQVQELRDRIKETYGSGGVTVMTNGAKLEPWRGADIGPKDVQLLEFLQFRREEILAAYHVQPALIGLDKASTGTTAELILLWKETGLAPLTENIEQKIGKFFGLKGYPFEFVEFDLDSLTRGDERNRIETAVREIQGGLLSVNEAREREDRPAVAFGEEPRLQAQMVPVSAAASVSSVPSAPVPPSPAGPIDTASRARTARLAAHEEVEKIERLLREETLRRKPPMGSA